MDIILSRKTFFDIWNSCGTLNYLRNAVEIIAKTLCVDSKFCIFDNVLKFLKMKPCFNCCYLESFEDLSQHNFSLRTL